MKKLCVLFAMVLASMAGAEIKTINCSSWNDEAANIAFPGQLGHLTIHQHTDYDKDDYSVFYVSDGWLHNKLEREMLTVYLFSRDGVKLESDGVGPEVLKEFHDAVKGVGLKIESGDYSSVGIVVPEKTIVLPKSSLKCVYAVLDGKDAKQPGYNDFCAVLVTAYKGRFLKLRYTESTKKERLSDTPGWQAVLAQVDGLIRKGADDHAVDVYAIKDDAARLAALKRKWVAAGDRVSQYDMPEYTAKNKELMEAETWCYWDDLRARAGVYAKVAREGIRLKLDPAKWYCSYACTLGRQEKLDEAILALEQAVAAGYNDLELTENYDDLDDLRRDPRCVKLLAAGHTSKLPWKSPKRHAKIESGQIRLDESNINWSFVESSYNVEVEGATGNTLIYLDHNFNHVKPPAAGMVAVDYDVELEKRGRANGRPNFNFEDASSREHIPTIVACSEVLREDLTNNVHSVAARIWNDNEATHSLESHLLCNVLGIYSIGLDYAYDSVDRLSGWNPGLLAYYGQDSQEELVRICAEAWQAMRPEVRKAGGVQQLLWLIRRGQKCVNDENDFRNGAAHRPAVSAADVDAAKVVALAKKLDRACPKMPYIEVGESDFKMTPITDIWEEVPFDWTKPVRGAFNYGFVARWAEKVAKLKLVVNNEDGEVVWKVLQGDASKVRFVRKTQVTRGCRKCEEVEVECEYQEAFDVALPDGRTMKSTRVDIGCFQVVDGVASLPVVFNVYFMPTEKREYGEDGLLKSVDYSKPQISGWRPWICPKADFKDEFHWTKDGKCLGWTRTDPKGKKTEFTRDGLVVMTRDRLGRPKDVRRSLNMEWMQKLSPFVTTGVEYMSQRVDLADRYDSDEDDPRKLPFVWKYEYENDGDVFGKPSPGKCRKFTYRPELCVRAAFTGESGFKLPMVRQMMLGHGRHMKYQFDLFDKAMMDWELPEDYERSDNRLELKKRGLVVPEQLTKMKFCPWKPSTNDLWRLDMEDCEAKAMSFLYELPDGDYRVGVDPEKGEFVSILDTHREHNSAFESIAREKLDAAYRRCREAEVRKVMDKRLSSRQWTETVVVGERLGQDDRRRLPKNTRYVLAMWQLSEHVYFGCLADCASKLATRKYFYAPADEEMESRTFDFFEELPSRAIGNAVLGANAGNAEALNNFAVLCYCGVANPGRFEEKMVLDLLKRAEGLGCRTATFNLGVLYCNRGEKDKAESYFVKAAEKGK